MLIEFKVEGFKNFEKELVFDLSKTIILMKMQ